MSTFNLKNEYIIKKFNNAVEIVGKHYKLEISKFTPSPNGYKYNYLTVPEGLVDTDDVTTCVDYEEKLLQIQNGEYSYLAPFYQVWMGEVDERYLKHITEDTFKEINKVIKELNGNKHKNIK